MILKSLILFVPGALALFILKASQHASWMDASMMNLCFWLVVLGAVLFAAFVGAALFKWGKAGSWGKWLAAVGGFIAAGLSYLVIFRLSFHLLFRV